MGASKIKDQCATRAISSAFETRNIISYRESSCHERWMKEKNSESPLSFISLQQIEMTKT